MFFFISFPEKLDFHHDFEYYRCVFCVCNFWRFFLTWPLLFGSSLLPLARCDCCSCGSCTSHLGCLSDRRQACPHVGCVYFRCGSWVVLLNCTCWQYTATVYDHEKHMFLICCTCWRFFRCRLCTAIPVMHGGFLVSSVEIRARGP